MLRTVEASVHIKTAPRLVYSVLADYARYRDWMPDVTASRVFAREGDIAVAELIVPPYGHRKTLLEFVESPPDGLAFQEVDRLREYGFSGRWALEPVENGRAVVVRARLQFKGGVLQLGIRRSMRAVLARTLDALSVRALRLAAAGVGGETPRRRKLLEIRRRESGLEVHLGDTVYVTAGPTGSSNP